ncbi:CaiB/BaiF CoA-transferase family protein [Paractinoplanes ferrugineus]|uniref:Alpha-methylacyl-CoA racemase n=1 Tax=Paractinoplanes ferrugineus TaxID=113564 RepID=A0A919J289_9ACTN|nr:CaiB/BaiF CoA-transferase family protein [Actinoplanes ferrugineus]GIE13180.1 alpha-methylacyl-CoA racemase [Actinoplanes ferrugineus]
MTGPLHGLRVIELAGTAPAAFAGTLLGDLGADVVRVDRPGRPAVAADPLGRNRRRVTADLKDPAGLATLVSLAETADVVIDGFRPGVTERLGAGPEELHKLNPRLVYARVTAWGQDGPWAARAGHDITFLALSGALLDPDTADPATPPPYYPGSFVGGATFLVVGILSALWERAISDRGQVVDASAVEGTAVLAGLSRRWRETPGVHTVTAAPFYRTYRCADGGWVAVGAIEDALYARLLENLDLDPATLPGRDDLAAWPALEARLAAAFRTRDRDEWAKIFADTDAGVVPVLDLDEAARHPQALARGTFTSVAGVSQPTAVPRFSRTPPALPTPIHDTAGDSFTWKS